MLFLNEFDPNFVDEMIKIRLSSLELRLTFMRDFLKKSGDYTHFKVLEHSDFKASGDFIFPKETSLHYPQCNDDNYNYIYNLAEFNIAKKIATCLSKKSTLETLESEFDIGYSFEMKLENFKIIMFHFTDYLENLSFCNTQCNIDYFFEALILIDKNNNVLAIDKNPSFSESLKSLFSYAEDEGLI